MKLKRMRDLARELGIPRETFQRWIERDPDLAVWVPGGRGGGSWWVKLDKLAGREGITLEDAYMLGSTRWIKAVELAALSGIPRKTIANWCRDRPGFAKRIGRVWYVDLEDLGASREDVETLRGKIRGLRRGISSQSDTQEDEDED